MNNRDVFILLDSYALAFQGGLDLFDIHLSAGGAGFDGHGRSCAGALPGDGAAHHLAQGRMGDPVSGHTTTRHQQVFHGTGQHDAVGHLKIPACGGNDHHAVGIQEFRKNADAVFKPGLVLHLFPGHGVTACDFPGLSHP